MAGTKSETRVRLTKKRLAALRLAVSMDDVLSEQFRRLREDLAKREQKIARSQQVRRVVKRDRPGVFLEMRILAVHRTPDGLVVEVV
jgi:hypothetical protein